jgi:hypothetical protein
MWADSLEVIAVEPHHGLHCSNLESSRHVGGSHMFARRMLETEDGIGIGGTARSDLDKTTSASLDRAERVSW